MLVDAHMHVNFRGLSADGIVRYLDENRIDCCWLLTWEEINPGRWGYERLSVESVWDAFCKHPSRVVPMYAPDPARHDAASELESWYRRGVRGCGELKATMNWDSAQVRSLLRSASSIGMPVVFHMEEARRILLPRSSAFYDRLLCLGLQSRYAGPRRCLEVLTRASPLKSRIERVSFPGYMPDFASLERALVDFRGVNFVAHGPTFWKHMSADAGMNRGIYPKGPVKGEGIIWRLLGEHTNLHADLSGPSGFNALARDRDNAKRFLSLFEDRILYGSDNFFMGQMQFLKALRLGQVTMRKILGDNAVRLARTTVTGCREMVDESSQAGPGDSR